MKGLDDIYKDGITQTNRLFVCSVCGKEYKNEKSAHTHINKRECHSSVDIFAGTEYEKIAFEFYKNILSVEGKKGARPTINSFRKSTLYKNCTTYILSCSVHSVDYGLLYSFLNEVVGFKFPNKILLEGQDHKWIREYKCFLHNHHELTSSSEYVSIYEEEIKEDTSFFIGAITSAKISISYIPMNSFLLDVVSSLSPGEYATLMEWVEISEKSKWRI